jgi:hypothetical protein
MARTCRASRSGYAESPGIRCVRRGGYVYDSLLNINLLVIHPVIHLDSGDFLLLHLLPVLWSNPPPTSHRGSSNHDRRIIRKIHRPTKEKGQEERSPPTTSQDHQYPLARNRSIQGLCAAAKGRCLSGMLGCQYTRQATNMESESWFGELMSSIFDRVEIEQKVSRHDSLAVRDISHIGLMPFPWMAC